MAQPAKEDEMSSNQKKSVPFWIWGSFLLLALALIGLASSIGYSLRHGNIETAPAKTAPVAQSHCHYGMLATFLTILPADIHSAEPNMPKIMVRNMGDPDPLVHGRIDTFFADVRNMRIDMVNGASFAWEKGETKVCILPSTIPSQAIVFEAWTDNH